MIRGPHELKSLTDEDVAAVKTIEDFIDSSPEFNSYGGHEMKITIPKELMQKCLGIRLHTRVNLLYKNIGEAGWKYCWFSSPVIHIGEYTPSTGDCRD